MAKGHIVASILTLRCFLFLLPNYANILVFYFLFALLSFGDEPEVFLSKYSQTVIPHAPHFQWVVNRANFVKIAVRLI